MPPPLQIHSFLLLAALQEHPQEDWAARHFPLNSPGAVFPRLTARDRAYLAAPCWQAGSFTPAGQIQCHCPPAAPPCATEYTCEAIAAFILIPRRSSLLFARHCSEQKLCELFQVDPEVLNFRRALAATVLRWKELSPERYAARRAAAEEQKRK